MSAPTPNCRSHRLLHQLAIGVHGGVGILALLIAEYSRRQGRRRRAACYVGLAALEAYFVTEHFDDVR